MSLLLWTEIRRVDVSVHHHNARQHYDIKSQYIYARATRA